MKTQGLGLVRTPVGDRYVVEHMRKHGYNVGGEQSGTHRAFGLHDDGRRPRIGLAGARCVVATGKPVSGCARGFTPLPQVLKNVRYANGKPLEDNRGAQGNRRRATETRREGPDRHSPIRHRAGHSRDGGRRRTKRSSTPLSRHRGCREGRGAGGLRALILRLLPAPLSGMNGGVSFCAGD